MDKSFPFFWKNFC